MIMPLRGDIIIVNTNKERKTMKKVLNLILSVITPEKRGIHDYIARVKPIDNDCQIYVKSIEELNKLKIQELSNKNGNNRY